LAEKEAKLIISSGKMKSFEAFPELLSKIKKGSKLSIKDIEFFEEIFGDRIQKALEVIGANGVKKYTFSPSGIFRWTVQGQGKEYLVIENSFCSCKDFLFTALLRKEAPSCYHLLAREIAEKIEQFENITIEDKSFDEYMKKWLD
jgi:predicted nucleic acid-binding Zn finger protein